MVALEQRVDRPQLQRAILGEPGLDTRVTRGDLLPLIARVEHQSACTRWAISWIPSSVGLAVVRQGQRRCGLEVPADRLVIESRLARHVTRALPAARRPRFSLMSTMISSR
ncbi:hypothetical protein WME75_26290 [Sorangium sp. So ce1014]|uniref:hypothetical protein n=1 Tax=Sorangium sp. So ce1014 TaxID=3133326 RepID=UPI003F6068EA